MSTMFVIVFGNRYFLIIESFNNKDSLLLSFQSLIKKITRKQP